MVDLGGASGTHTRLASLPPGAFYGRQLDSDSKQLDLDSRKEGSIWIRLDSILRVNFFKSDRSVSGQNLDHLHTIAIQTGLMHIKTGLNIFGVGRTYMATGWIIDFGPWELNLAPRGQNL